MRRPSNSMESASHQVIQIATFSKIDVQERVLRTTVNQNFVTFLWMDFKFESTPMKLSYMVRSTLSCTSILEKVLILDIAWIYGVFCSYSTQKWSHRAKRSNQLPLNMFEIFTGMDWNLKSFQWNVTKKWFLVFEVEVKIHQIFQVFEMFRNHAGSIQRPPRTCREHKTVKICYTGM